MSNFIYLFISMGAGASLGILFFWGLWLTIKKGVHAQRPGLLFASSTVFRVLFVLLGFLYVSGGYFDRLGACLLGFLAVRWAIWREWEKEPPPEKEDPHETKS